MRTIADARLDPSSWPIPESAFEETDTARRYLTTPSKDLATVCSLAGVEVEALLERMQRRVAGVPAIQTTQPIAVTGKRTRNRGVCLDHDGRSLPINRWSEITGISAGCIADRLRKGWTVAEALTVPTKNGVLHALRRQAPKITYDGETLTFREWADRTGLTWFVIRDRVNKGWPVEEVLSPGDLRGAHMKSGICFEK
ncbi:MAG: hypothetical protein Q7J24_01940 [Desulfomicrobium sp.]|nr:hypothetical protein [Desulfomicrobium sp.]